MAITTDNGKYANQVCKCYYCKREDIASFKFDFYPAGVTAPDGRAYLMCERCMMFRAGRQEHQPAEKPTDKATSKWDLL